MRLFFGGTLIFALMLAVTALYPRMDAHGADPSLKDQRISIDVQGMPLGDVLKEIERTNGYEFNIDEQWKKVPVSVTLYEAPLDLGLKRILANLNNVIIYSADSRIKIIIFGKAEARTGSSRPRAVRPPARQVRQPNRPPVTPQPENIEETESESPDASEEADDDEETSEETDKEQETEDEPDSETETEGKEQDRENEDETDSESGDDTEQDDEKTSDEVSDKDTPEKQGTS